MDESLPPPAASSDLKLRLAAAQDCFGEHRGLGISVIEFKVAGRDDLFVLENVCHGRGGPPRHLHLAQDEWFYALEGEFLMEVGPERFRLGPGDSVLALRRVPHVWAHIGRGRGRILVAFTPAGAMESFFREVTKPNAMSLQNPELLRAHGMELLGPPLAIG
jgi:mannose-6-phosphate isomerase-like protein (cupin superfamily)